MEFRYRNKELITQERNSSVVNIVVTACVSLMKFDATSSFPLRVPRSLTDNSCFCLFSENPMELGNIFSPVDDANPTKQLIRAEESKQNEHDSVKDVQAENFRGDFKVLTFQTISWL